MNVHNVMIDYLHSIVDGSVFMINQSDSNMVDYQFIIYCAYVG